MNPQDDPQWRLDRCGSIGASEIADATRQRKDGKPSATRAALLARKVCERLTGVPVDTFTSRAMQDGRDREAEARTAYEFMHNVTVELVGVVKHPLIEGTHASPDGLVGNHGLVQIKCPEHAAHLAFIRTGKIDGDYIAQMQHEMGCSGRHWCDYASYHPDFPAAMQLVVKRVERDAAMIDEIEDGVRAFLKELDATLRELRALYGDAKEAA